MCTCDECARMAGVLAERGMSMDFVTGMSADQVAVAAAVFPPSHFRALADANDEADARGRRSSGGMAPVHAAARAGNAAVVELLVLEEGADPDVRDAHGRAPLHCALAGLLASEGERRPLWTGLDMEFRSRCALRDLAAALRDLAPAAARSDAALRAICRSHFPKAPFAAEEGLVDTALALLEAGAAVDAPDALGHTAFDLLTTGFYLAGRYHARVARRLFDAIDARYRDPWGMTPLMHAAVVNETGALEGLLARGADPMARCSVHHRTALHYAVRTRAPRAVDVLRTRTCLRALDRDWMRPADLARLMGAPGRTVRALTA